MFNMFTRESSFFKGENVKGASLLALGLIVCAVIASWTVLTIRSYDNTLVVTGSAKTSVTSDSVKWTSNLSRTVTEQNLQQGHSLLARDLGVVKEFLAQNGVKEEEITVSPVFTEQVYKYDRAASGPTEYTLRQTVTVDSKDLDTVTRIAKNTQDVVAKGVILSANAPEYYYSKLSELRVNLLADAIKDARARAEQLARTSGSRVGDLKSASSGVTQVLSPNSIDVSDYGQYDTSSIEKDVMITVKATFIVR